MPANPYRGYRFPEEIISQCVWLYFNFCVSFRDVELSYETEVKHAAAAADSAYARVSSQSPLSALELAV